MRLFLVFLLVPLIEIGLFIQVGGLIGLWPTLAIVVVTAVAGTWLVRAQGMQTLERLRGSLGALEDPLSPLAHGAMILFSGALLLTPGFFTDAVGFLLLVPAVRARIIRELARRVTIVGAAGGPSGPTDGRGAGAGTQPDVIDADWTEVTPRKDPGARPSGWTRH